MSETTLCCSFPQLGYTAEKRMQCSSLIRITSGGRPTMAEPRCVTAYLTCLTSEY